MSSSAPSPDYHRLYTVEEYFALEEVSEVRHEYHKGEIFPLDGPRARAGSTFAHNTIKQNCVIGLRAALKGSGCRVFDENVRTEMEPNARYTYPDVVVTCESSTDGTNRLVRQPTLVIEVLSDSTAAYDRGVKLDQYMRLPSMRQIILIHQKFPLIQSYVRPNETAAWTVISLRDLADVLHLPILGLELSLALIYDEVTLGPWWVWRNDEEKL